MDNEEEMLEYLKSVDAIYEYGLDEQGELIYRFNMDVLQVVLPPLYEAIMEDLDKDLMKLYELGLVEIEYNENLEACFRISEKGRHYIKTGEMREEL